MGWSFVVSSGRSVVWQSICGRKIVSGFAEVEPLAEQGTKVGRGNGELCWGSRFLGMRSRKHAAGVKGIGCVKWGDAEKGAESGCSCWDSKSNLLRDKPPPHPKIPKDSGRSPRRAPRVVSPRRSRSRRRRGETVAPRHAAPRVVSPRRSRSRRSRKRQFTEAPRAPREEKVPKKPKKLKASECQLYDLVLQVGRFSRYL
eukprot:s418_g22.t1